MHETGDRNPLPLRPVLRPLVALAVCLSVLGPGRAEVHACSVPTFRYWLERLEADLYTAVLFCRDEQMPRVQKWARQIEKASTADPNYANIRPVIVNLDTTEDERLLAFYEAQGKPALPHMMVFYPPPRTGWGRQNEIEATLKMPDIWSGTPSDAVIASLLDSPVRRRIVRGIYAGDSVVYLFVPGKDKRSNDRIRDLMRQQLPKLQQTCRLPAIAPDDLHYLSQFGPPLHVAFRFLELRRDTPGEQMLLSMLRKMDPELYDQDKPMLFCVFARGRLVPPIPGEQITEDVLAELSFFFTGECSCEIKGQLPGVDLLMTAGWAHYMETPELQARLEKNLPLLALPEKVTTYLVDEAAAKESTSESADVQEPETASQAPAEPVTATAPPAGPVSSDAPQLGQEALEETVWAEETPEPIGTWDAKSSPLMRNLLLAGGAVALLAILAGLAVSLRRRKESNA